MEERIAKLEKQVAELMAWKEARTRQQLTFPLDKVSSDIIFENVIRTTGQIVAPSGLLTAETAIEITVNGMNYWVLASPSS